MRIALILGWLLLAVGSPVPALAQEQASERSAAFLKFIKTQAESLRANDRPPAARHAWETRRTELRNNLIKAWGGFPAEPCELSPRILGELKREGYRIEKLIFQTRPGIWMTANA